MGMLTRRMLLEATWRLYGEGRGCYRHSCCSCGEVFFASRPEARYCQPACRQRAYRMRRRLAAMGIRDYSKRKW
jgi:hypothetical protein